MTFMKPRDLYSLFGAGALVALMVSCEEQPWPPPEVNATALVTPAPARLAPDGVYFLKERTTVSSEAGVYAVAPATEVRFVSRDGTVVTVTNGEVTFSVEESKLTSSLDERDEILKAQQ